MLKFLTHKLRTHSLNEESVSEKVEERDSGTESDDEAERGEAGDFCADVIMKWNDVTDIILADTFEPDNGNPTVTDDIKIPHNAKDSELENENFIKVNINSRKRTLSGIENEPDENISSQPKRIYNKEIFSTPSSMGGEACACAPAPPRLLPEPEPDHLYDHHSSEEELEVINGAPRGTDAGGAGAGPAGAGSAGAAESRRRGASSPPPSCAEKRKWPAPPYHDADHDNLAPRPASSDDDDTKVETPVRFRTSPPLEALKPRRAGACGCAGPRAPPSPRRRRTPLPPPRRHRPALDFDKMQQLRVGGGGVRSWRAVGGAHGGELSVFCW